MNYEDIHFHKQVLRSVWIQIPMAQTVVSLLSMKLRKKQSMLLSIPLSDLDLKVRKLKIPPSVEQPTCPMSRLLKCQPRSLFKHLILPSLLCWHLITSMSVNKTPDNLKDTNCGKGLLAQWPPIPYVPVTSILTTSALTELIKVKLNAAGDLICLEVSEEGDNKKYQKYLMTLPASTSYKGCWTEATTCN